MITTLIAILPTLLPIAQEQPQEQPPSDYQILLAWSYLLPNEKTEVSQWFTAETGYFQSAQNRLIDYMLSGESRDRGTWPIAAPLTWFDPETHSPSQPIKRKLLDATSPKAKSVREAMKGKMPSDPLVRAWDYDWTTGGIIKVGEEEDPELIFANGMMGLPPRTDLAEALLLRRLDDGSQRATLTAFHHYYTDRSGNAYPGVTLYDAWCSGRTLEMPDVDNLGIYHELFDDWKTYKAPVPESKHKKLYGKIGDAFLEAKSHRQLLEAVTANYIRGNAIPTNVYTPHSLALNALWQECEGDPELFAKDLPDADDTEKYLKGLVKKVKKKKFRELGQDRVAWFEAERWQVKAKLIWVMEQFNAFDRDSLPETPKKD
ncbi:MAG: hypothetical protein ACJAZ8_001015 [Planctomycetota bacterium]|jgi:hypothetical protein